MEQHRYLQVIIARYFHFHHPTVLVWPPKSVENYKADWHLRLLELVGSGRTSVRHSRNLAAVYDSDVMTPLGANVGGKRFIEARMKQKHSCPLFLRKSATIQLSSDRECGLHERALRSGASLPVKMSFIEVPMKKSCDDPTIVMESWPALLPTDFVPCHFHVSFFWWVEAPERKPSLNQISSPFFLVWLRPLLCCQKDIWRPWWTMWPNCQTIGNTSWRITQDIWFVCGTHTWTEVLVALFTVPSQGAQQVYFCFFHFLFTHVRAEEPPKNHLWNAFPTPLRRWNRCVGRQLHVPAVVIWFFTIFDEFSG